MDVPHFIDGLGQGILEIAVINGNDYLLTWKAFLSKALVLFLFLDWFLFSY